MKKFYWLFLLLTTLFCGACRTEIKPDFDFKPTPEQKLTNAEIENLTAHARNFVSSAKNLKLTDSQRGYIRRTSPKITVKYFGPKYGQICMDWQTAQNQMLRLYGTGDMTSSRFPWKLDVRTVNVSHPVPDGFLKF